MKNRISKRDWVSISAYLDGQLSPRQRARLESRLQKDHQLKQALIELRNTSDVLRYAPRLTAPRNFMLTPEMVDQTVRGPHMAPIFGWASALASFLFIIVMMGDLFTAGQFVPVNANIPVDEDVLASKSQAVEDQMIVQPPVAGELEAPLQESADEPGLGAIPEESALSEAPVESVSQSTPTQALIAEGEEVEIFTMINEATSEAQERRIDATAVGDARLVSPTEATIAQGSEETTVPSAGINTLELSENTAEAGSAAELDDSGSSQEQGTELTLEEGKITQPQESIVEQPAGDLIDTLPVAVPSPTITWIPTDVPVVVTQTPDEDTGAVVFGAEVILGLFAIGTGLAWFYMRLQGS